MSHFVSQIRLRDFFRLLAIGMCHFLPVHHFGMACLVGSKVKIQQVKIQQVKITAMTPLNNILRMHRWIQSLVNRRKRSITKCTWTTSNCLQKMKTLTHAVRIYSQDIGIEFYIEKCTMQVMKSGKRHLTDEIELLNQDKIRTLEEKETYKYLGILEADTIKQVEMKEKIKKEYLKRTRKLLETKVCSRNLIK